MNLADGFFDSATTHPTRPALLAGKASLTYRELLELASSVGRCILQETDRPLVGLVDDGTLNSYPGLLGILLAGRGYVPLNARYPEARTADVIRQVGFDGVVCTPRTTAYLDRALARAGSEATLIVHDPGPPGSRPPSDSFGERRVVVVPPAGEAGPLEPPGMAGDDTAYVMFTSGSTGRPKGVVVSTANILAYLGCMAKLYELGPEDRFLQLFDLTFDASIFPAFVAFDAGAAVVVAPPNARMAPAALIERHGITVWCSVPTTGALLRQQGALRKGAFPSLRYSCFCGEALPVDLARAWARAAPRAPVDNHYGPTEVTVTCAWHRWDEERSPALAEGGIVPLGRCYPGTTAAVVDDALAPVPPGELGEICLQGPQVSRGYLGDPEKTAAAFVSRPLREEGPPVRWYRTGDLGRMREDGTLVFAGRVDHQVKVRGYRVELGEVEAAVRRRAGTSLAVAVPFPPDAPTAQGLVVFVPELSRSPAEVLQDVRQDLPPYMVPSRIEVTDIPLNPNRKVDRGRLAAYLGALDDAV